MMSAESRKNAVGVGIFLTLAMPMLCNLRSSRVTRWRAEPGAWGATVEPNLGAKKGVRPGDLI
jgi:hypothetical protein